MRVEVTRTVDEECPDIWKHQRTGLRIAASKVSAIAGYHPWTDLLTLFHDCVYQGRRGAALLRSDCALLGIELADPEAELSSLISKAGQDARDAIEKALATKSGDVVVNSTIDADEIKQRVVATTAARVASGALTELERLALVEAARAAVDTSFGCRHEDAALDAYERITGWEVTDRNTHVKCWDFPPSPLGSASAAFDTTLPVLATSSAVPQARAAPAARSVSNTSGVAVPRATGEFENTALARQVASDQSLDAAYVHRDSRSVAEQPTLDPVPPAAAPQPPGLAAGAPNDPTVTSACDAPVACSRVSETLAVTSFLSHAPVVNSTEANATAESTAAHNGLVVNPTSPVLGTTTSHATFRQTLKELPRISSSSPILGISSSDNQMDGNQSENSLLEMAAPATSEPLFCIRGSVDGVSQQLKVEGPRPAAFGNLDGSFDAALTEDSKPDQVFCEQEAWDAEVWSMQQVIVEVKHRMGSRSTMTAPPLYDQIQLVVYMNMYGVDEGDLVQCYRDAQPTHHAPTHRSKPSADCSSSIDLSFQNQHQLQTPGEGRSAVPDPLRQPLDLQHQPSGPPSKRRAIIKEGDVIVTRIRLDDKQYRHAEHWENTVLPRLYVWVNSVYRVRASDELRWQWLCAMAGDDVNLAEDFCRDRCKDTNQGSDLMDAACVDRGNMGGGEPFAWKLLMTLVPYLAECNVQPFNR
ncbi:hypothetical protein CYMTET_38141 [Cymbomonas tetramitiformis]|uniref:Uncharacterized protein n=1 Tax=Cymbomonas tetramitiformis TaxID=36881 RepID=A0AAE0F5R9_9CHLO|nr:hypothetical protein CYMTET_38141 [Cymbomonas tetramitiformis]